MKLTLTLGLMVLSIYCAEAARRINVATLARSLKAQSKYHATREELCSQLGLHGKNAIVPRRSSKTALGREKERLQQTYGDLEVVGGGISADYNPTRGYTGTVSGELFTSLEEDIPDPNTCDQTEDMVTDVAFKEEGITTSQASNIRVKKNVYIQNGKACLTYEINFFYMDGETPSRPCYFINACDLTVVYKFNNIQHKAIHKRQEEMKMRFRRQSPGDDECPAQTTKETTSEATTQETTSEATTQETTSEATTQETTTSEQTTPSDTTTVDQCGGEETTTSSQSTSQIPQETTSEAATEKTTSEATTRKTTSEATTQERTTQTPTQTTVESGTTAGPLVCTNPARGEGGNEKVGRIIYGVPPLCLNTTVSGSTCTLENDYVKVIDLKQTTNRGGQPAASYTCSQGYDDAINGAYSPVLDAMHFGTASARMFIEWFNMTALNFKPVLYVHYGSGYENAFWDGSSLTFGDGRSYFYPLVNQDVVAHELAHGVTSQNSDLIYDNQSGGINEAFSDITGDTTEMFARGSNDWNVGSEIFKNANGALRYFDDPTKDGRSLKHVRDYNDNVDVHYSSGIVNHAFYQMVHENNMPIRQAYECFLYANLNYWGRSTTFEEGACDVMRACHDLGYDHLIAKRSFQVVGITFADCVEPSFMETLSADESLTELIVSSSRKPVYTLEPPQGSTQVTVRASGHGNVIKMAVYDDLESGNSLMNGAGEMVYKLPSSSTSSLYLRLSADTDMDISGVTLQIKYQ